MARERFRGLGKTSFVLAFVLAGAKGLGFLREILLTQKFGASAETDAFYLIFALVILVSGLVIGSTPKVLVPRYLAHLAADGERSALAFLSSATALMLAVCTALGVGLYVYAEPVVAWSAPEFGPEQAALATRLARILAAAIPAAALSGAGISLARARGHFYLVEVAALGLNAGTIVGIVLLSDSMGVASAAVGAMGGLTLTCAMVLAYPVLERLVPALDGPAVRRALPAVGLVGLVTVMGSHGGYAAVLVDRYFAAKLPEGHFSCMGYSARLLIVPMHVLYGSMAVALLPALADRVAAGETGEVQRMTNRALRMLVLLMVPILIGIATLGDPIVSVAFGRGAFGQEAIALTAALMLAQLPSMATEALRIPLDTVFFSHGRTITPSLFGVVRIGLMLALYPFVWEPYGAIGLALAMGLADAITVGAMLIGARRMLGLRFPGLLKFTLQVVVVSAGVAAAAWWVYGRIEAGAGIDSNAGRLVVLAALGPVCYAAVLGLARAVGIREVGELVQLLKGIVGRRLGRRSG